MAISEIPNPMATAVVRWLSRAEGGRRSGPPVAPIYMATAAFQIDQKEAEAGLVATEESILSIMIKRGAPINDNQEEATLGFLVPDLARPLLFPGRELLIMEGPRVVAFATIRKVFLTE